MDFPFRVEPVGPFHRELKDVKYIFSKRIMCDWSQNSVVGKATHYGLYGPEIESQWGQDFRYPSRPATGPTQPPLQWILCLFLGVKQPGRGVDHPPLSSAKVKKESWAVPVVCLWAFMTCSWVNFYYYFWLLHTWLTLILIYCRYKSSHMQILLRKSNIFFILSLFIFLFLFFFPSLPHNELFSPLSSFTWYTSHV